MFYLENNTTFSGSDIKVYAYRNVKDFLEVKKREEREAKKNNTNPLYPNDPFADWNQKDIDLQLSQSLEGIASGKAKTYKQKDVVTPDGNFMTITDSEENPLDAQIAQVEKQYAAPKFKDLSPKFRATFADGSEKIYESEAELDRLITQRSAENVRRSLLPMSTEMLDVPSKSQIEAEVEVTFSDGTKKTVSQDEASDLSSSHVDAQILNAPSKTDYSAVQTNKVNPNYIDIVKTGSDKKALELARKYQLEKVNKKRNEYKDAQTATVKTKPIIELGSLYSITYSSFREKHAVRTLGRVSAKDYTRGQRTIAGSMNFAVFQSHELMDFLKVGPNKDDIVILDQLPKFNIMMIMMNEYGGASILHLFGVTISTESQQTSVEDLALMNNVTFYAEDIMTIENIGNLFETSLSMLHPTIIAGRTLQFYKGNTPSTLSELLDIGGDVSNNKIQNILNRSRGLF